MEPMGLLAWIVVGLISGWLASKVVPSRFGLIGDTVIGMVGALVGGFLFEQFGSSGTSGLNIWSILVAFVGAVVLLILIRAVSRQGTASA
ncbi:GlsB/YeaQ/YmgE family stress response membrane protein [Aggregatilinea lenta]|uniref:GlsB/YeaQ/YmgE family stress response membrane protein n=1 Tax=Aggregatilinea lenta TaxID=913108 RepID=UPI001EE8B2C9|nr:GlsB/YeaQ/YmgE family stress response membrane protein [Aggregatilinea lenta]